MGSDPRSVAVWHLAHRAGERSFRMQAAAALDVLPPGPGMVLDLGSGTCPLGPLLTAAGRDWVALDRDEAMLGLGAKRCGRGAALVRGDALRLPFPAETFGAVLSLGLFEYLPDPGAALREVGRVLRAGGRAVLTVPRREAPWRRLLVPAAALLALLERRDPFDLTAGRDIRPREARRWARGAGLALLRADPVAPALVPWPVERLLPVAAERLAARAPRAAGTAWLFCFGKP